MEISTDPARLDVDLIDRFLSEESYWARGRTRKLTERAIAHSLCFGAYDDAGQLATTDAHDLYRQYGFGALDEVERWMIRRAGYER